MTNKKKILKTWHYLLFIICIFSCFVTTNYAKDVFLQWEPNSEPALAGYRVYYREEGQSYDYANPYWECIDITCTIYDLDETKTYYFVVRAFNIEGLESGDSNEVILPGECYGVFFVGESYEVFPEADSTNPRSKSCFQ